MQTSRVIFATFCVLGICAISVAAALEVARFRRGSGVVGARQFRLRLVSATIWIAMLAVNFYAVTWLWPMGGTSPLAKAQAKLFLLVVGGAFSLLLIALFLLFIDVWHIARARSLHQARFEAEFAAIARQEAAKAGRKDPETKQT